MRLTVLNTTMFVLPKRQNILDIPPIYKVFVCPHLKYAIRAASPFFPSKSFAASRMSKQSITFVSFLYSVDKFVETYKITHGLFGFRFLDSLRALKSHLQGSP